MNSLSLYELPFKKDDLLDWVYDKNNNFIFQFDTNNESLIDYTLKRLNGEEIKPKVDYKIIKVSPIELKIQVENNEPQSFITIRGWGNLTGIGGHNLSETEAVKIQFELYNFIINKLKYK